MPDFRPNIRIKTEQSHSNPSVSVPFLQNERQFTHFPKGLVSAAMIPSAFSFSTPFFPADRRLVSHHVSSSSHIRTTELQHASRPTRISCLCQLSPLAATLATVTVLFSNPSSSGAAVEPATLSPSSFTAPLHSAVQHNNSQDGTSNTQGTLLRVKPRITQDSRTDSSEIFHSKSSPQSSTPTFSQSAAGIQGWVSTRLQRTMKASKPVRVRVRPATLGLVGVGAFTSGSALLRSIARNNTRKRDESFLSTTGVCSVVSMQIPFCVSERTQMLQTFDDLLNKSSINDAEGMANASRTAARILLAEEGLLEDSRKFAPYIDVFLAENLASAERRFACHVATEESRLKKIETYRSEEGRQLQGLYGVTTMVVATTEGVDLECYDEHSTLVCRLRHALDSLSTLRAGEVAGLELVWVPENLKDSPLTRAQISDAYPWLKVG